MDNQHAFLTLEKYRGKGLSNRRLYLGERNYLSSNSNEI